MNMLVTRCVSISRKASAISNARSATEWSLRRARSASADARPRHATAARPPARHRLSRARRQVGEMIGDDEAHLAMGQHRRLGTSRGARGEEEPAGIVVLDRGVVDTAPACAAIASRTRLAEPPSSPIRQTNASAGLVLTAAACSGNRHGTGTPWRRRRCARYATSSGIRRKLVGTQTAPSRNAANIEKNISSQFLEWTRMRSPLRCRARARRPPAPKRAARLRQVQDFSPQMKPDAVAVAAGFWVMRYGKVHDPARHPRNAAGRRRGSGGRRWTAVLRPIQTPARQQHEPQPRPTTAPCLRCASAPRRPHARGRSPAIDPPAPGNRPRQ